ARRVGGEERSRSAESPGSPRTTPPPPSPPPPRLGPPRGTSFSRRKLVQPSPPSPASTRTRTSSTNFMTGAIVAQGTALPQRCSARHRRFATLPAELVPRRAG